MNMKIKKLLFMFAAFISIPWFCKAENKIYFEQNEVLITPGDSYSVDIMVDSDSDFSEVHFNVITSSNDLKLLNMTINDKLINKSDTGYLLHSDTPLKSGTKVATLTFTVLKNNMLNKDETLKLVDAFVVSDRKYTLDQDLLNVKYTDIHSNLLKSLSSRIANIAFKRDTFSYEVTVGNDVDVFDLVAVAEDKNANIKISSQKLVNRKNTIKIKVTQDNLEDKVYEVIVVKKDNESNAYGVKECRRIITNQKKEWTIILACLVVAFFGDLIFLRIRKK